MEAVDALWAYAHWILIAVIAIVLIAAFFSGSLKKLLDKLDRENGRGRDRW